MPEPGHPPRSNPDRGAPCEAALGIAVPGGPSGLHRFSHGAMATLFEVFTPHADRRYAAQAAQAAFDLLDRLERELSRFVPNSDIARINTLRAGQGTKVGPATMECLAIARHVFELTGGAFDISLGTGLPALEVHDVDWVRAAKDGVQLDLGAIGKGYAVDCMGELLEEWELGPALVHGGFSSVLALDPPDEGGGWPLSMSDPDEPSRLLNRVSATQKALGASGLHKGGHIRDPRTGRPAHGRIAAWAAVPRPVRRDGAVAGVTPSVAAAAVADALSTASMLMTFEAIQALCDVSPGLEVWILPAADGNARELRHFAAPDPGILPSFPTPPTAAGDEP